MIVAIDIDGVLANYNDELAFIVERDHNLPKGSLEAPTAWDFPNWNMHKGFEYYHKLMMGDRLMEMKPYHYASEVVTRLYSEHTIRIVTQRASPFLNDSVAKNLIAVGTILWLVKQNIPFHEICFVENKTTTAFDLIIEDSPIHLKSLIDAGRDYIIMDHKYNRHIGGDRVTNLLEAEEIIRERNS